MRKRADNTRLSDRGAVPEPAGAPRSFRWGLAAGVAGLAVAVVAGVAARSAWAGAQTTNAVVIDTNNRNAQGDLGFVRSGAGTGTTQRIGCYTLTYGSGLEGLCTATNSAGTTRTCSVSALDEAGIDRDKVLFDVIAAISGDSYLSFSWDTNNKCTSISLSNSSTFFPKSP